MVARDDHLMEAICDVALQYEVAVFDLAGSAHEQVATRRDVSFVGEFYVGLGYRADGTSTNQPPAAGNPTRDRRGARRLAITAGVALAEDGTQVPVRFDSICVHSDTPNAVDVAAAVRDVISAN